MYDEIVKEFRERKRNFSELHISHCLAQDNLVGAIKVAAKAIDKKGKINSHQRRVGRENLDKFASGLVVEKSKIEKAKSFDDLLSVIESIDSERIGVLTKYDTALRIGAFRKLYPDKVYLHAGTKIGVRYLLGKAAVKGRKCISINQLPPELLEFDLTASELEDLFCHYI